MNPPKISKPKKENEWEVLIFPLSMEFAVDDSPWKELLEAFRISRTRVRYVHRFKIYKSSTEIVILDVEG